MLQLVKYFLTHPLTRDLKVDDPRTTSLRRRVIRQKPFLHHIYEEWYRRITALVETQVAILEIGSGAGFLSESLPSLITSEVFWTPDVSLVADACHMPFGDRSLDAIVMTDVLHHIPNVGGFFSEASRCVRPGGKIVMIEPWYTPWSRWVYTRLHTEPFQPDAGWNFPPSGPLSSANGALPWIVFERDRSLFERGYPQWRIAGVELMMPFSYLISGGVSFRSLIPGWCYRIIRSLESKLAQHRWAMFALIELELK